MQFFNMAAANTAKKMPQHLNSIHYPNKYRSNITPSIYHLRYRRMAIDTVRFGRGRREDANYNLRV
jgi:hypothetical protein